MPRHLHRLMYALAGVAASAAITQAAGRPGTGSSPTIVWNGVTWGVKTSQSAVGPGPNLFDKNNAWVDGDGKLHLKIAKNSSGAWSCAEIIAPASYGYGTYDFVLASAVSALDPNVVLGLFTWSDKAQYAHREIDIEFARWGNPADPTNAQYVVQPYNLAGHLVRFTQPATPSSLQRFHWHPGTVAFESYDQNGVVIASNTYNGSDVPRAGDERVHLNLWLMNGLAPASGLPTEVVLSSFTYTP